MSKKSTDSRQQYPLNNLMDGLQANRQITADHMQKLIDLQMNAASEYIEVHMDRMKAATQIRNGDTLMQFVSGQIQAGNEINGRVLNDMKALGDLTRSYMDAIARHTASTAERATDASTSS